MNNQHSNLKAQSNTQPIRPPNKAQEQDQNNQETMNPIYLMQRVRSLQQQLTYLATAISEDSNLQQVQLNLYSQNQQLKTLLATNSSLQQKITQLQTSNSLLKDSLMKQNQQMQQLYNQLQQARISQSRLTQKTNSQQLQQKINELNDQISNLLMKIQSLMQEINEQQNQRQDLKYNFQEVTFKFEESKQLIQELKLSNQYLKEEISKVEELSMKNQKDMQDRYIQDVNSLSEEIQLLRKDQITQHDQKQKIKKNHHSNGSGEDKLNLSNELLALRNQIAYKNQEIQQLKEIQLAINRKWQKQLLQKQQKINKLSDELSKIENKLKLSERSCSNYAFQLQQRDKDQQRLNYYKNNQKTINQQLKQTISKLQQEKQQFQTKIQHLQLQISNQNTLKSHNSRDNIKKQPIQPHYNQSSPSSHIYIANNQQITQQLQLNKQLIKGLKVTITKYEQDYKQLRLQYQALYQQKSMIQKIVINNQSQLHKNKSTYQQLVVKYDRTAALYEQLQQQLRAYQKHMHNANHNVYDNLYNHDSNKNDTFNNTRRLQYDKQDYNLIKLQNSTLKQQLTTLRKQLQSSTNIITTNRSYINKINQYSSNQNTCNAYNDRHYNDIINRNHQIQAHKLRQKQLTRQLSLYHKKYLAQIQKGRRQEEYMVKIDELQEKLNRVNKMLNENIKQLDLSHQREVEMRQELESSYIKHKQQFDTYGVKHHPQIKKLQSQLLSAQKTILQMQFHFKQQNTILDDQTKSLRLENQHHLAKIDQLIIQLTRQRNNVDYNKMSRSLELAQLRITQLQEEIEQRNNNIESLNMQIQEYKHTKHHRINSDHNSPRYNNRNDYDESFRQHYRLNLQENSHISNNLKNLETFLNSIDSHSIGKDPCLRAISLLEYYQKISPRTLKQYIPTQFSMSNIGKSTITQDNQKDNISRYQSLLKQRNQMRQQFDSYQYPNELHNQNHPNHLNHHKSSNNYDVIRHSQQSEWQRLSNHGRQINQQRKSILRKYVEDISG